MRIFTMALVLILGTLTARAEPDARRLVDDPDADTRFGTITLVEAYTPVGKGFYRSFLSVDGHLLRGLYPHALPRHVYDWGAKGDVVLINEWSGGASCCNAWFLLHLTDDGFVLSERFAEHGRDPSEFWVQADSLGFRMERDYPASVDHWRVRYDGQAPTIEVIYETEDGFLPAGPGEEVTRWVGSLAWGILQNPSERLRYYAIMDRDQLYELRTSLIGIEVYRTELRDGFLVGNGCWPHRCGERTGFLAIEVATGAPFAAILWCNELELFKGGLPAPAPLLEMISEERERRAKRPAYGPAKRCVGKP
ncbi:MAG: hypothetical protein AAGC81_13645 [Pseudomonadota bacterium]